jgi:hypothetical protein
MQSAAVNPAIRVGGRIVGSLLLVAAGLANAGVCLLIAGFACDEGCTLYSGEGTRPGVPWRDTADAWQWSAIGTLGVASLALAVACALSLHFAAARRRQVPLVLFALGLATGLAPWLMLST